MKRIRFFKGFWRKFDVTMKKVSHALAFMKSFYHKGEPTKMNKSLYGELFEDGKHIITQDGKSIQDLKKWRFYDSEVKKYLKLRKE